MAGRTGKQPKPGKWQYTVGEVPFQLTAYERPEKGMVVYARVWDGARYTERKKLCDAIRDERGRIIPDREIEAQQAAVRRQAALAAGVDPVESSSGPLTLEAGFRKRLHPAEGEWPTRTPHVQAVERAAVIVKRILGKGLIWSDIRHAHYRKVWRELAREHKRTGEGGYRWTEVVLSALQSTSRWLQQEGLIEPGDAQPAPRWHQAMRREWGEIVGAPVSEPEKPRYTAAQSRRLWEALPKADPRLRLGMEIGAELRLGQVIRSRRSDVLRSPDSSEELYAVRVHGKGKKLGETVVLTPESRAVLVEALTTGYLANLERDYQAGKIEDYPLFPGHRLATDGDGVLRSPATRTRHLERTGLYRMWYELEEIAGIKHQEGMSWYGMRRLQSDLAEDVESDARVLNKLGAWKHTATREGYQEQGRMDIAEKAAETRRKIRPGNDLEREKNDAAD